MENTGTLKVTTPTDREIVMTRVFDALSPSCSSTGSDRAAGRWWSAKSI